MIPFISVVSVVTSFSFLIFFYLSPLFLVHLAKGLSILFTFSKNQFSVSLIFAIIFLVSISFVSVLIFMISFLLLMVLSLWWAGPCQGCVYRWL